MSENIVLGEKIEEAVKIANAKVYESNVPQYEIFLPDQVVTFLGLTDKHELNFIEENGRVYIEKA